VPKRIAAAAITAVADSGADGDGALGVLESAGARATLISMDPDAVGCTFAGGITATGLFAAPGAAGNQPDAWQPAAVPTIWKFLQCHIHP
jgi:hypothetical protein